MKIKFMLVFTLLMTIVSISSAQKRERSKSRSPFKKPESEDIPRVNRKPERHHQDRSAPQSPFTPPREFIDKKQTTLVTESAATKTVATTTVATRVPNVVRTTQIPHIRSPFSPPPEVEWREMFGVDNGRLTLSSREPIWIDTIKDRQRENINDIPPLDNIDIRGTSKVKDNDSRRRSKAKPKVSTYQSKGHRGRDIHDDEPGVTPWTRYTDKPRPKEEPSFSGKANARCARLRYNPRNRICCHGRVVRRHGVSPACCGKEAYDTVFNKCCNGAISARTNGQPDC